MMSELVGYYCTQFFFSHSFILLFLLLTFILNNITHFFIQVLCMHIIYIPRAFQKQKKSAYLSLLDLNGI